MALLQASPCPCPPSIMADCILSTMLHAEVFLSWTHFALRLSIAHSTWHRKWETECVLRMWDLLSVLGKVTLSRCTYALWPQMTPQSDTWHWHLMLGLPWFPPASRLFSDYSTSLGHSLWQPHHAGWGPLHEGPILSFSTGLFLDTDCPVAGPGKRSGPCTH